MNFSPLEACNRAAELLRAVGFEHRYTSLKSEACYYALPNVPDLFRIAVHSHDRGVHGLGKIIVRLTFSERPGAKNPNLSEIHIQNRLASSIGWYMLRATGVVEYTGRQPRFSSLSSSPARALSRPSTRALRERS